MNGILSISGKRELSGIVAISGSKFSAIPIVVGSLLATESVHLSNLPQILDVEVLLSSLHYLGVEVTVKENTAVINASSLSDRDVPDHLITRMRGTFLFLPTLLVRRGHAATAIPGGNQLGLRPFDEHLRVISAFGAEIAFSEGRFRGVMRRGLKSADLRLRGPYPSPGATKAFLIMATGVAGTSVLENASILPDVTEFISFLTELGARIHLDGTTIIVEGGQSLRSCSFMIPYDRIETLTWVSIACITKSAITIKHAVPSLTTARAEWRLLRSLGLSFQKSEDSLVIDGKQKLAGGVEMVTGAYPEFNTDAQPILTPLLMVCKNPSSVVEKVFGEFRFRYLEELRRMGGSFKIAGNAAKIFPVAGLRGAIVHGYDIRGTTALAVAGLAAEGSTTILNAEHIDRGYENFVEKAARLGAVIKRISE